MYKSGIRKMKVPVQYVLFYKIGDKGYPLGGAGLEERQGLAFKRNRGLNGVERIQDVLCGD